MHPVPAAVPGTGSGWRRCGTGPLRFVGHRLGLRFAGRLTGKGGGGSPPGSGDPRWGGAAAVRPLVRPSVRSSACSSVRLSARPSVPAAGAAHDPPPAPPLLPAATPGRSRRPRAGHRGRVPAVRRRPGGQQSPGQAVRPPRTARALSAGKHGREQTWKVYGPGRTGGSAAKPGAAAGKRRGSALGTHRPGTEHLRIPAMPLGAGPSPMVTRAARQNRGLFGSGYGSQVGSPLGVRGGRSRSGWQSENKAPSR